MTKKEVLAEFFGSVGDAISPTTMADFSDKILAATDDENNFDASLYVPKKDYDNLLSEHKKLADEFRRRYVAQTLGMSVGPSPSGVSVGDKLDDKPEEAPKEETKENDDYKMNLDDGKSEEAEKEETEEEEEEDKEKLPPLVL